MGLHKITGFVCVCALFIIWFSSHFCLSFVDFSVYTGVVLLVVFFIVIVACIYVFCVLPSLYLFSLCSTLAAQRGTFINVRQTYRRKRERKRIEPSVDYLTVLFNKLRFHWIRFLLLLLLYEPRLKIIRTNTYTRNSHK